MSVVLEGLEDSFDNESAEKMLQLSVGQVTYTSDLVRKSLYDFDLETPEGIEKLMALIPIMDPEILKDIMTELWPGYPTDVDARRHRLEIKGYLKDYLESINDLENEGEESGSPEEASSGGMEEAGGSLANAGPGPEPGGGAPDGNPQGQEGFGASASNSAPPNTSSGTQEASGTLGAPGTDEQGKVASRPAT